MQPLGIWWNEHSVLAFASAVLGLPFLLLLPQALSPALALDFGLAGTALTSDGFGPKLFGGTASVATAFCLRLIGFI